jgi:hypothetical protein
MKRSFVLALVSLLFALALTLSSPHSSRVVNAAPPDKCVKCLVKLQKDVDRCYAENGETSLECADLFNAGIVHCYATVCEQ